MTDVFENKTERKTQKPQYRIASTIRQHFPYVIWSDRIGIQGLKHINVLVKKTDETENKSGRAQGNHRSGF